MVWCKYIGQQIVDFYFYCYVIDCCYCYCGVWISEFCDFLVVFIIGCYWCWIIGNYGYGCDFGLVVGGNYCCNGICFGVGFFGIGDVFDVVIGKG